MANSEHMKKDSSELKKVRKRDNTLESDLNKIKEKLDVEETTRKSSVDAAAKPKLEADAT